MSNAVTVLQSTFCALQDEGRLLGPRWGIATNGALDQFSFHFGNAVVGNESSRPSLETTLSDLVVRFDQDTVIAITGAECDVTIGSVPAAMNQAVVAFAGWRVSIRNLRSGTRVYVSVAGGFHSNTTFLGSVSPDSTLGFGLTITAGTRIECGPVTKRGISNRSFPFPRFDLLRLSIPSDGTLGVLCGENTDLFHDNAQEIFRDSYEMTDQTDAVGSRIEGCVPRRKQEGEILSRALPVGAIEVTEQLIVLNRGRGLSAGYPVVGVICSVSMDRLSQTPPGECVSFRRIQLSEARRLRARQGASIELVRHQMLSVMNS